MVIKERKTADEMDLIIRNSPTLMNIMTNGSDSQLAGSWMDWFTEEYIRKVCDRTKSFATNGIITYDSQIIFQVFPFLAPEFDYSNHLVSRGYDRKVMCDGCIDCPDVDYISEDSEDTYFLRPPREMNDPVEDDTVSLVSTVFSLDDNGSPEIAVDW